MEKAQWDTHIHTQSVSSQCYATVTCGLKPKDCPRVPLQHWVPSAFSSGTNQNHEAIHAANRDTNNKLITNSTQENLHRRISFKWWILTPGKILGCPKQQISHYTRKAAREEYIKSREKICIRRKGLIRCRWNWPHWKRAHEILEADSGGNWLTSRGTPRSVLPKLPSDLQVFLWQCALLGHGFDIKRGAPLQNPLPPVAPSSGLVAEGPRKHLPHVYFILDVSWHVSRGAVFAAQQNF